MQRDYWWLGARDGDEDFLIFGSATSEEDARQKGLELLGGTDFVIKKLGTRDRSTASALWKGHKLEKTHSLHTARQKLLHEKGIKRKQERLKKRRLMTE